jgi:uncharacterized protein (TIGR02271 family)
MHTTSRRPWSELALLLGVGTAVLIAAAVTGAFDAPGAWALVAVLAGGYALSRGIARNDLRPPDRPRPARAPAAPSTAEHAAEVVVSEEQLEVDKQRRPTERVRLRKDVVTEQVTITVPVRREVVRVERVPIEPGEMLEEAVPFELTEGRTQELVLMEERAIVDTRVVPRERVWLEKDVETTEQHFTQTVRREEVELDHEPAPRERPEQEQTP